MNSNNINHNPVIAVPCTSSKDIKGQKVIALVQAEQYHSCEGCYYHSDGVRDCIPIHDIQCNDETIYKEITISPTFGNQSEGVNAQATSYIPTTKTLQNPAYDSVEKPKHYMLFPEKDIEVRDLMKVLADQLDRQGFSGMLVSDYIQMMQYLLRWHNKNGSEDLEKASWYLDKIIKEAEETYEIRFNQV